MDKFLFHRDINRDNILHRNKKKRHCKKLMFNLGVLSLLC